MNNEYRIEISINYKDYDYYHILLHQELRCYLHKYFCRIHLIINTNHLIHYIINIYQISNLYKILSIKICNESNHHKVLYFHPHIIQEILIIHLNIMGCIYSILIHIPLNKICIKNWHRFDNNYHKNINNNCIHLMDLHFHHHTFLLN